MKSGRGTHQGRSHHGVAHVTSRNSVYHKTTISFNIYFIKSLAARGSGPPATGPNGRGKAENPRKRRGLSAATTRLSASTTRLSASTTHLSASTTRLSAATTRLSAATTRLSAATTRLSVSTTRLSAATTCLSASTTRLSGATTSLNRPKRPLFGPNGPIWPQKRFFRTVKGPFGPDTRPCPRRRCHRPPNTSRRSVQTKRGNPATGSSFRLWAAGNGHSTSGWPGKALGSRQTGRSWP